MENDKTGREMISMDEIGSTDNMQQTQKQGILSKFQTYVDFLKLMSGNFVLILSSCLVNFISTTFESYLPFSLSTLLSDSSRYNITKNIFLLLTIGLLDFVRKYLKKYTKSTVQLSLITLCFKHFMKKNYRFFQKNKTSKLLNYITTDVKAANGVITKTLFSMTKRISKFVTTVCILLMLQPKLTLCLLATLPISLVVNYIISRKSKRKSKQYNAATVKAIGYSIETMKGIMICKAFSHQKQDERKFQEKAKGIYQIGKEKAIINTLLLGVNRVFTNIGTVIAIYVGYFLMNQMQVVSAFLIYTISFNNTLNALAKIWLKLINCAPNLERIIHLIKNKDKARSVLQISSDSLVSFENVCFSYSSQKVLKKVTFSIQNGEYVGIVGQSGCGKSTILKLMLKLYESDSGQVNINTKKVGYVPQEAVIFSQTMRYNVDFTGKMTDQEIKQICQECGLTELLEEMPQGLDTKLGTKGYKLSGGQKQRICLARALSIKPELLLLDEATASLDAKNEDLIHQTILRSLKRMAVVSISHRMRRWDDFHRVIFLEKGKINCIGRHRQLLRDNQHYKNMCTEQL